MTALLRRTGVAAAVLLAASTPLVLPARGDAAGAVLCHASMSDSTPSQYTNLYVRVRTGARAYVHTVAHYKTTNSPKNGRASSTGHASVKYYISGATPGYRVHVSVTVTKNGHHGYCSTSFVPHR
jgi:hypothetical protein